MSSVGPQRVAGEEASGAAARRGGRAGSPADLLALGPGWFPSLLRGFWVARRADCEPGKRGGAG